MSTTRLLVLGGVRRFGRAHGYEVRRELMSWGSDEWAHVNPGSIYHALRQLAKEGLLRAHEVEESEAGPRTSITRSPTRAGRSSCGCCAARSPPSTSGTRRC